jgi:hypothetical protein
MTTNRILIKVISLLLCLIIISCTLVLSFIFALGTTIFSEKFFIELSTSKTYKDLVIDVIEEDISAQSSYVGIPAEILILGFDEQKLGTVMNEYMSGTSDYLNFRSSAELPQYPSEVFVPALLAFLEEDAKANSYTPAEQQYSLLLEVASDTAGIIEKHLNLFQLDMFNEAPSFRILHHRIFTLKENWPLVLVIWFAASFFLFMMHRRKVYGWVKYQFTSLWTAAAIISVPALVFTIFNLAGRLAIETPYIKFAVERLLDSFIENLLVPALVLMILSSIVLFVYFLRSNRKSLKKP